MRETKSERVTFEGATGSELCGVWDQPIGEPRAAALFAHCFTCSKDVRAARRISGELARHGISTLRFDFTGLGESAGDFADTDFSSNVDDLLAAVEHMRERGRAPALLVGHSLGGAAILAAAGAIDEARAVCTIGAPCDPAHVEHLLSGSIDEIESAGEAEVTIAGRTFRVRHELLRDIRAQPQAERIRKLRRALLVLHSPTDEIVGVENARRIFEAALHPKSFVALDGAGHLLPDPRDARFAAEVLAHWASRYLEIDLHDEDEPRDERRDGDAARAPGGRPDAPDGVVRVASRPGGGFTHDVAFGARHTFVADEPADVGGADAGPSPYELLAAGLGACTAMTLRMYAERKGWALDSVTCDVRHEKVHARDCEHCDAQEGKLDHLDRTLRITGDLDDDQLRRLLEIADKCPVHRTLEGGAVEIHTELDEPASERG